MNFKFSNLLGAPYRGGNLLLHGSELLSPVGNRVSQIDLAHSVSQTLPFENLTQIRTLALSPDGQLLLSIDESGRALLIARTRRVLLHHFSFKGPVAAAAFSPDGRYLAAAVGRLLQVWHTPTMDKQLAPMQLHRTYGTCTDTITCLDWAPDSRFIAVGSKDLAVRLYSLHPIPGWTPPTLAGHKAPLVGVWCCSGAASADATLGAAAAAAAAAAAGEQQQQDDGRGAVMQPGLPPLIYSVSRDGALFAWGLQPADDGGMGSADDDDDDAGSSSSDDADEDGGSKQQQQQQQQRRRRSKKGHEAFLGAPGAWQLVARHFFLQRGAKLSAADYHRETGLLVAGFSNGLFELYRLPGFVPLQTLSISSERISAACISPRGDWLALGCARLGQLLVWEWASEGYVLRQQGHQFDVAAAAYSPDGALVATGADDAKLKVFQLSSGFCYVTFAEHAAPITALAFLPSGSAVLSASLDGSVRAFDLLRYRNFRTMTAPAAVQFVSLAVEPGGEVVVAGTQDDFQVYVWSIKTGRLLDVLAGHEGPVCGLAFSPTAPLLASCSWDKTVRTWDVYDNKAQLEVLQHNADVLALAWRPDGKQLAAATLDGQIYLWNPADGVLEGVIEGRRDIRGGRLASDRRAAGNLSSGAAFTSLAFSADGRLLFAGGRSKYVCVYDVAERLLLRRFQITNNRSLDGVLDQLNSKQLTDAGPLQLIDHDDADSDEELLPPGGDPAAAADLPGASSRKRPTALTRALALSPAATGWAAATTEGLLVYALDRGLAFDPTDLTEALTPAAFHQALGSGSYVRALLIALRLGDSQLLQHGIMSVPLGRVGPTAAGVPALFLQPLLSSLAGLLDASPHMEYLLTWTKALLAAHGPSLAAAAGGATALRAATVGGGSGGSGAGAATAAAAAGGSGALAATLRALQQVLTRLHGNLAATAESNVYLLDYLLEAGRLVAAQQHRQQQQEEKDKAAAEKAGGDGALRAAAVEEVVVVDDSVRKQAGGRRSKQKKHQDQPHQQQRLHA